MSALDHKRTYAVQYAISALVLIATKKADTAVDRHSKACVPPFSAFKLNARIQLLSARPAVRCARIATLSQRLARRRVG